jgi:hypothetical protein
MHNNITYIVSAYKPLSGAQTINGHYCSTGSKMSKRKLEIVFKIPEYDLCILKSVKLIKTTDITYLEISKKIYKYKGNCIIPGITTKIIFYNSVTYKKSGNDTLNLYDNIFYHKYEINSDNCQLGAPIINMSKKRIVGFVSGMLDKNTCISFNVRYIQILIENIDNDNYDGPPVIMDKINCNDVVKINKIHVKSYNKHYIYDSNCNDYINVNTFIGLYCDHNVKKIQIKTTRKISAPLISTSQLLPFSSAEYHGSGTVLNEKYIGNYLIVLLSRELLDLLSQNLKKKFSSAWLKMIKKENTRHYVAINCKIESWDFSKKKLGCLPIISKVNDLDAVNYFDKHRDIQEIRTIMFNIYQRGDYIISI